MVNPDISNMNKIIKICSNCPGVSWVDDIQGMQRNFIDENGKYLFDTWFDGILPFDENGISLVHVHDRWNGVTYDGKYAFNTWYEDISNFRDGYYRIKLNNKYNYIDSTGNYLFKKWFYHNVECSSFNNGYIRLQTKEENNMYNYMGKDGKLLFKKWYMWLSEYDSIYSSVKIEDKGCNFIDKDENILFDDIWFEVAYRFSEGYASVKANNNWNFIDINQHYLCKDWYDWVYCFSDGFAVVGSYENGINYVDHDGKYLLKNWVRDGGPFINGVAMIKNMTSRWEYIYNFITTNGEFILKDWVPLKNTYVCSDLKIIKVKLNNEQWVDIGKNGEIIYNKD